MSDVANAVNALTIIVLIMGLGLIGVIGLVGADICAAIKRGADTTGKGEPKS